jgi:hypothetical protein
VDHVRRRVSGDAEPLAVVPPDVNCGQAVDQLDNPGRAGGHLEQFVVLGHPDQAVSDPPSLVDLRRRVEAMLPEIDLPELVLEVMSWVPGFTEAFTHASG